MRALNIQEVAVDAVGPKVLGEAGEHNIARSRMVLMTTAFGHNCKIMGKSMTFIGCL